MRTFLGISTFVVTFGLSFLVVGFIYGIGEDTVSSHATEIESFLREDVSNGSERNFYARQFFKSKVTKNGFGSTDKTDLSAYSDSDYRDSVVKYVATMSKMDASHLPSDFQRAWWRHVRAWKAQGRLVARYSRMENSKLERKRFLSAEDANTDEINESWRQVLSVASRHGVKIDLSFYS